MFQLIETIKCSNGNLSNPGYHTIRFNKSRRECFRTESEINLADVIHVPKKAKYGLYKCRILYSEEIEKIEFIPHEYRKVESIKMVEDNEINYSFKYTERKNLEYLFEKRADCDDILIVKNGWITDSFSANVVFYDGTKWWTPGTPLLCGTQRARLINEGKISVCNISRNDIPKFKLAGLINAMQDLKNMPVIPVDRIH